MPANVALNLTYGLTGIGQFTVYKPGPSYKIDIGDWQLPSVGNVVYVQYGQPTGLNKTLSFEVVTATQAAIGSAVASLINNSGFSASYAAGTVTTNVPVTDYLNAYWFPSVHAKESELVFWQKTNGSQSISGGYTKIEWNKVIVNGIDKINLTDFKVLDDTAGGSLNFRVNITLNFPGSAGYNLVLLDITGTPSPLYFESGSVGGPITQTVNLNFTMDANTVIGKTLAIAIEKTSGTNFATTGTHNFNIDLIKGGDLIGTGFKSGSTAGVGIVYFDDYLRQGGVQAKTYKYVDFPPQRIYKEYYNTVGIASETGYIPIIDWEIKHIPPVWATRYCWVFDGGTVQNYAQFVAIVNDPDTDVTSREIKISPKNLFEYKYIFNSFSEGDRIRLLFKRGVLNVNTTYYTPLVESIGEYIEGVVIGFSSIEILVQINDSKINLSNIDGCLIEIFSISKPQLFFEFTPLYDIGNPGQSNRYHKGPVQNQDPNNPTTVPAKGIFTGNCYFRLIPNFINEEGEQMVTYLTESNSITYNAESAFWSKGRPQIETPNQKQQRIPWMFRWGGKLFQDTEINNMNMFDSGNYRILSAKFGAITGMREIGYTLKIIQEVNYSSAFIGRRELQESNGVTQQVLITDDLIGTINPSEYGYGTKYPGSILVNNNNLYFWDTTKGRFIRESGNMPFAISNYGMINKILRASQLIVSEGYEIITGFNNQEYSLYVTWFSDMLNQLLAYTGASMVSTSPLRMVIVAPVPTLVVGQNIKVTQGLTSFIAQIDLIVGTTYTCTLLSGGPTLASITKIEYSQHNQETLAFYEPQRENIEPGWIGNHDMTKTVAGVKTPIDMYGWIGSVFTTALNGSIYEHNLEGSYLNLFGENKDFRIRDVFNMNPDQMKVFLAHVIRSNIAVTKTTFTIRPNQNYPNGMKSILKQGNYKLKEGAFDSAIKRDAYTKGVFAEGTPQYINGLINGRAMRGRAIEVEILYQGNDIFVLFSHGVIVQYSPLS